MEKSSQTLATECQVYLENGPPKQMTNYVPGSLTEVIITHGAQSKELDPELAEIGSMVLFEAESIESIEEPEIKAYMLEGVYLVQRILELSH